MHFISSAREDWPTPFGSHKGACGRGDISLTGIRKIDRTDLAGYHYCIDFRRRCHTCLEARISQSAMHISTRFHRHMTVV